MKFDMVSRKAALAVSGLASGALASVCPDDPVRFDLVDPPYTNYFYSDCNSAAQVVVTSPLPSSNLTVIGPRFLVAWPAGNSGIVAFFEPQDGPNGTLAISLANSTSTGNALDPIYKASSDEDGNPIVGVSGHLSFNASAQLSVGILGSIRTIRDFIEGPSLLRPEIQEGHEMSELGHSSVAMSRMWLDNVTTTTLSFESTEDNGSVTIEDDMIKFSAGVYAFNASFDYPQLEQLSLDHVLTEDAQDLIEEQPELTQALGFFSYTNKILTGAWRFLTYFGRDSIISMLLLEPIMVAGVNSSYEAGVMALLERVNKSDGTAAHEETLGDYATWLHMEEGVESTEAMYDYKMIDTDYFLPVVLAEYFIKNPEGAERAKEVLAMEASENPDNKGVTYRELALKNAEKIMDETAAFAAEGGQVKKNLIHLLPEDVVGEWRDSTYGLGGGRIPYNVNTAIVPAGLRAIQALAKAGFFPEHCDWALRAADYARIWEDETLHFFEVEVSKEDARELVDDYVSDNDFPFPSHSDDIDSDVHFYGLALDGNNGQKNVRVMNSDDCFRHFLLNTTNQEQLSAFISQTADHILAPYPLGLTTDVGMLVANPAFGGDAVYSRNFTNSAYHGTVVWSWQLSMMAKGLERQLGRCEDEKNTPDFCSDEELHDKVLRAYNRLWDVIEENQTILGYELWSWRYQNDKFVPVPLGELPPPDGENPTESNIIQLWSLTFLAVTRNEAFQ